jgi:hypothetical protein
MCVKGAGVQARAGCATAQAPQQHGWLTHISSLCTIQLATLQGARRASAAVRPRQLDQPSHATPSQTPLPHGTHAVRCSHSQPKRQQRPDGCWCYCCRAPVAAPACLRPPAAACVPFHCVVCAAATAAPLYHCSTPLCPTLTTTTRLHGSLSALAAVVVCHRRGERGGVLGWPPLPCPANCCCCCCMICSAKRLLQPLSMPARAA